MKKTVLVNHLLEPPNQTTGITRYLFSLLTELTRRDTFRYVLMTNWDACALPNELLANGLDVQTQQYHPSLPRNILRQLDLVPDIFKEHGASVEFNCNPLGGFLPAWPRVVVVHDLYMRTLPNQYRFHHRLWWRLFFPLIAKSASQLICVSHVTQSDLLRHYPWLEGKTTVIHEAGALKPTHLPTPRSGHAYALFVGNISPNKNIGLLVDALAVLEEQEKRVSVHVVGGDGSGLLAEALSKCHLTNPITIHGSISDEILSATYANARLLVSASTQEGFCLPVLEAHERSVPVVCPDIPIFHEVAGAGALFFQSGNAVDLADNLDRVMHDDDVHQHLAQTARKNASRFSWRAAAEKTELTLDQAILSKTA